MKTFIQDAEQEGNQELVEFFDGVLDNNLKAAQRAKEMPCLASRASKSKGQKETE